MTSPPGPSPSTALPRDPQLLKGVLPLLVLAALDREESYGWQLVTRLQDVGLADLSTGTVYPVLSRLEREGHLQSRLVPSEAGPARKYYRPTPGGLAFLDEGRRAWRSLADVVAAVLHPLQEHR